MLQVIMMQNDAFSVNVKAWNYFAAYLLIQMK